VADFTAEPLLDIRELSVDYLSPEGPIRAAREVSLTVNAGEIVGLVGESGSGKSTVLNGAMRILGPPAVISGGEVFFKGRDVLAMSEAELRAWRWREISVVPQSALNALNPVLTIGAQVMDTLAAHGVTGGEARRRADEMMELVGIDPMHLRSYPHGLSGGMRQRVALGLALILRPPLVVMDEPTTALDVVVEREILQRITALQAELGFAVLYITHDLSHLLEFATRIGVLYSGRLVELAPTSVIHDGGRHPYTQGLIGAIPSIAGGDPRSIPGAPPSLRSPPPGCRFNPRCTLVEDRCRVEEPAVRVLADDHLVACHVIE